MAICESCGRDEPSVTTVQRMYLAASDADAAPAQHTAEVSERPASGPRQLDREQRPTAGDIESWCASCCASFPHVVIDPD